MATRLNLSSNPPGQLVPSAADYSANFQEILLVMSDLVVRDPVALQKWPTIANHIVKVEADKLRVKGLLKQQEPAFEEAVLSSLTMWHRFGNERADLLKVLQKHGLNSLADELSEPVASLDLAITTTQKSSIWFDVGEVVYNFTGRQTELDTLHKMLAKDRSTESSLLCVVCISGLGGIGKTNLARKYAHTYRKFYDGNVVLVNAETRYSMRASFTRLLKEHFGMPVDSKSTNDQIVQMVHNKLGDRKVLMIFDNVEDEKDFKIFSPKITHPDRPIPFVLITSRQRDLTPMRTNRLDLDVLTKEEAEQLIMSQLPDASGEDATLLADKLQRLPLAIQQAMAYIGDKYFQDTGCVSKYLEQIDKSGQELLNDERFQNVNDYSLTTFTTWQITLERINQMKEGETAIQVINILAYLNPDNIRVGLLEVIVQKSSEQSLRTLEKFSMIGLKGGKVAIHRLVQQVIKLSMGPDEENVLNTILDFLNVQFSLDELTDRMRECVSHGLHIFPVQVKYTDLMMDRSVYLSNFCATLIHYGNFADFLSIAEQSSSIYESLHGNEHEATIRMKWRRAQANYFSNKNEKALKIINEILPISQSKLGANHGLTINILSSLADVLSAIGENSKAIEIYDEIILVQLRANGEDDVNALRFKHSKAIALSNLGQFDDALQLFLHVHEGEVTLHGPSDRRPLGTKDRIADIAYKKRELRKALEMKQEVYATYMQTHGEVHPFTLFIRSEIEDIEKELRASTTTCTVS